MTPAERLAAERAHYASWLAGRKCPSVCFVCARERERHARIAARTNAPQLDRGDGMATLFDVKEAAGIPHGGFLLREVTTAPFGGTEAQRNDAIVDAARARIEHDRREVEIEKSQVLALPSTVGSFICSTERCLECGSADVVALCDGKAVGRNGTCDAAMCAAHRNPVGSDRDLCFLCFPQHGNARNASRRRGGGRELR